MELHEIAPIPFSMRAVVLNYRKPVCVVGLAVILWITVFKGQSVSLQDALTRASRPTRTANTEVNYPDQNTSTVISYSGGVWPTDSEFAIPDNTTYLSLRDIALYGAVIQPIQNLPSLTTLTLRNLSFHDSISQAASGPSKRFPLREFTVRLSKAKLQRLFLIHIQLPLLTEGDFEGFSGLMVLVLDSCNVVAVHPRTFYPFSVDPVGHGQIRTTVFSLTISNDHSLERFPWESLLPLSESLEVKLIITNLHVNV